jgi:hypothetical protein
MKATLVFSDRKRFDDGAILTMRIWQVPAPVPPTIHGYKYSLFYGYPGQRLVGYDNERGKGDHRHIKGAQFPYAFVSVEQLVSDFFDDVRRVRGSL